MSDGIKNFLKKNTWVYLVVALTILVGIGIMTT